jgi:hypothetical protein
MNRMSWRPSVDSCHQRIFGRLLMNETSSVICTSRIVTMSPKMIQKTMSAAAS